MNMRKKNKHNNNVIDDTAQQVREIIAKECCVKELEPVITNKTQFMSGQRLQYFDCINALFTLQHKFHVVLPESDYRKFKTVGDLIRNIKKQQRIKSI